MRMPATKTITVALAATACLMTTLPAAGEQRAREQGVEQAGDPNTAPKIEAGIDHVSCIGGKNEIRIRIDGLEKSVGLMTADLYRNDPDGFLKRTGRIAQVRFAAKAPQTAFCMRTEAPGDYAIAVYHDENANKTFDKKAFGLPAEPYGISNNPIIRFGPPSVDEALFNVTAEGADVRIELRN